LKTILNSITPKADIKKEAIFKDGLSFYLI